LFGRAGFDRARRALRLSMTTVSDAGGWRAALHLSPNCSSSRKLESPIRPALLANSAAQA